MAPKNIRPEDTIMARATYRGRIVATFVSNGFSSIVEVLRAVRAAVGSLVGCLDINLRNASRGWTADRALFITAPAPGTQMRLF